MLLLDRFQTALTDAGDVGQRFVRYPATEAANRVLSEVSDARVVWGGNAKISAFETLPLRDGGKAIWFGDRRSLAMVDGPALAALAEDAVQDLAERLHNDIFVFDQMACSSPIRLFVVGEPSACRGGVERLLERLSAVAVARGSVPATGHVIRKMVVSMAMAASGEAQDVTRHSNSLTTLRADRADDRAPVGGGFLEVTYVPDLPAIGPWLRENVQTIVHAGFGAEALADFARSLPPYCVTRIVPAGQALDFDAVWDGYDLFAELTRLLRVR